MFLNISKNSQENTSARVFFKILYSKKTLWHSCFLVNLAKLLRTYFLHNTSRRLLQSVFWLCDVFYLIIVFAECVSYKKIVKSLKIMYHQTKWVIQIGWFLCSFSLFSLYLMPLFVKVAGYKRLLIEYYCQLLSLV